MFTDPILLASASPRRRELLQGLGVPLFTLPADIDESVADELHVAERVARLAELKALAAEALPWPYAEPRPRWILGADTLVAAGERVYGKAEDEDEARATLKRLADAWHEVHSGVALLDASTGAIRSVVSTTRVLFGPLSEAEIEAYLGLGEWRGAAGAYRLQEAASLFVERIEGSYSGVVGLPLREFYGILRAAGYPPFAEAAGRPSPKGDGIA